MITPRYSRVILVLTVLALAALACVPSLPGLTTTESTPPPEVEQPAAGPPPTPTAAATATPLPGASTLPASEMAASLRAAAPPPSDPFAFGIEVGALDADTPRTRTAPTWEVGAEETFRVGIADPDGLPPFGVDALTGTALDAEGRGVEAELRLVTDQFYVWVDSRATDVRDDTLQTALTQFSNTGYGVVQAAGVGEWTPGMDDDPRLHLIYVRGLGVDAEFRRLDEFPTAVYPPSAEREAIFVNLDVGTPAGPESIGALTREYWRLVQFDLDPNEPRWSEEGLALLMQTVAGYPDEDAVAAFLSNSDTQLNALRADDGDPTAAAAGLGASYLYHTYVMERAAALLGEQTGSGPLDLEGAGLQALGRVADSPADGLGAIEAASQGAGLGVSADELFFDWTVANLLDDRQVGDGRFGYASAETGGVCPVTVLDALPKTATYQMAPYTADYHELIAGTTLDLDFEGQPSTSLGLAQPFSGGVAWWSGRGQWTQSSLTRTVDLSQSGSAALEFALWYDIAPGDAAFVLLSTDGGETWNALQAPHSVMVYDTPAFTGRSGGGDEPAWVLERIDLTPYAGQEVQLSFAYVTGGGETGDGVMLDDISVGEIGFFDGAEAADTGWQADGWLRTGNAVLNTWGLYLVSETPGQGEPIRTVTPFAVDADGSLSVSETLPSGTRRSWVVVALAAPGTDVATEYTLTIDGDFTPALVPEDVAGSLAAENFESSCGLFRQESDEATSATVADGVYTLAIIEPRTSYVSVIDGTYDDVVISVDTRLPPFPATDSTWGAVCRYQDESNYYGFEIRTDGSHRIYAVVDGVETDLSPFEEADIIETGPGAENSLVASCVGETLGLTVNGEVVAAADDSSLRSGQVGLALSSAVIVTARASFDNFLVTGPTGAESTPGEVQITPTVEVCDCSGNIYNCADFSGREAAQSCYNFCGGRTNDVHLLDADGNGIVCETVFP